MPGGRHDFRVVIVDDHELFAESLDVALGLEGYDVHRIVPREAGSLAALRAQVLRKSPRVVLLDLDLGSVGNGAMLVHPLAERGVNVVIITATPDEAWWGFCLDRGARLVIPKTAPLRQTISTVRKLQRGQSVITATARESMIRNWATTQARRAGLRELFAKLTDREEEIVAEMMLGRTVREVAHRGQVSEATVRTQVRSILAKLQVSSQLAAVGLAHEIGWHRESGGLADLSR